MRLLTEQQRDAIKAKVYQTDMLAYRLITRHRDYNQLPYLCAGSALIGISAWHSLVDARFGMPIWSNRPKRKMKGVVI